MANEPYFVRTLIVGNTIKDSRGNTLLNVQPPGTRFYVDGESTNTTNDGLSWATALTTIQAAVDLATDKASDIIYVAPHKYQENVIIVDKDSLSIVASGEGWEMQCRMGDAATKYPTTPTGGTLSPGYGFLVLSRGVTIDGFMLDCGGGYSGIYVGDGYAVDSALYDENSASARIKNCFFRGGGEGLYGIVLDGCSDDVVIDNCRFDALTLEGIYIIPGGSRTVQNPKIKNCDFANIASGKRAIDMYDHATTVGIRVGPGNFFGDKTGVNGYSCRFQGAGVHHFFGNFDCTSGGATGSATDFMAGNFEAHAANSPVYVAES
jgi:hypothetical protein